MTRFPLTLIGSLAASFVIFGCGGAEVGQPGESLAGPGELFSYQCADTADVDVTDLVSGGVLPYSCELFVGPGGGTVPTDTTLTDCVLSGGAGSDDAPGYYGYLVRVTDAAGAVIDVPIGCDNGPCNNADTAVTITPEPQTPRVGTAGEGYSFTATLPDVNIPCSVGDCSACNGCISTRLMPKPLPVMALTTDLDCAEPGTVCLVRDTEAADSCPDVITSSRVITVLPHEPIRDDGGPAWETVPITIGYSGPEPDTCGPNSFVCHTETLTLPE